MVYGNKTCTSTIGCEGQNKAAKRRERERPDVQQDSEAQCVDNEASKGSNSNAREHERKVSARRDQDNETKSQQPAQRDEEKQPAQVSNASPSHDKDSKSMPHGTHKIASAKDGNGKTATASESKPGQQGHFTQSGQHSAAGSKSRLRTALDQETKSSEIVSIESEPFKAIDDKTCARKTSRRKSADSESQDEPDRVVETSQPRKSTQTVWKQIQRR
ncbi:uncharacterized protein PAN0_006d2995 [Moesziomyces antarcticus]|uniref:Uncharacterized protein n=1 Tax=Pseudozyma antarctica TaxID=84753 RepID=A0A081CDN4_PSEA2|nr:uncharacterized protein PAN0_006d2995 [Moesziomyces antarcticus]GAK64780.1 hypothetical protein PAN0_006d2995 [Moesziomyces antarcticus]